MVEAPHLASMEIERFRAFERLVIPGLSRVSLFVGANNAGKTSILEAAEALALGSFRGLLRGPQRRGERVRGNDELGWTVDLSHLFHRHEVRLGTSFEIRGDGRRKRRVAGEIVDLPRQGTALEQVPEQSDLFEDPELEEPPTLGFRFESHQEPRPVVVSIFETGALPQTQARRLSFAAGDAGDPVHFVGTEPADPDTLVARWDQLVLTPEEDAIIAALRIIEPDVQRVAFVGGAAVRRLRAVMVKLAGSDRPVPLGSLGDGFRRILALALNLLPARGGVLLVDEIDSGLHYSVMPDMWRMVIETARRLDAQVLATTHSLDCVHALAWIRSGEAGYDSEVSLHKVEAGRDHTVGYSLDEIEVAARQHLEVR